MAIRWCAFRPGGRHIPVGGSTDPQRRGRASGRYYFLLTKRRRKARSASEKLVTLCAFGPFVTSEAVNFHPYQCPVTGFALARIIPAAAQRAGRSMYFSEENSTMDFTHTLQGFAEVVAINGDACKSIYGVTLKATERIYSLNTDFAAGPHRKAMPSATPAATIRNSFVRSSVSLNG